MKNMKDQAKL